ncbi:hypothetical protein [Chitinophaga sp. S165]|uniref:hypothetical protein n=1 Tax=Chitinophaga sp. S165 TaxID=2135462 RepID=UPI000D71BFFE|nr:hypothetical protein [Chitinophaga sp. S165]PWV46613.1 hypothetical protein C7475_110174 [Chitinophaga sp. S165]
MKKILLLALLFVSMLPTYAQTSIGIIGGYNRTEVHFSNSYSVGYLDKSSASLWRAGLIADHHLWKKIYLQPQLLLNAKGENSKAFDDTRPGYVYFNESISRLLYLELQSNFIFKQQWGKGSFFAGAGPYIGRGIKGRDYDKGYVIIDNQKSDFDTKTDIIFSSKQGEENKAAYQKPYDAGLSFQAGYELQNGLFFNAVYSLGLSNLGYDSEVKVKNNYFGLSVGYFFKKFN